MLTHPQKDGGKNPNPGKASSLRSTWARYGLALAWVAAGLGVSVATAPLMGGRIPFVFFVLASLLAAWTCGLGPGLLALAAGFLIDFFFALPARQHTWGAPVMAGVMVMNACLAGVGLTAITCFHRSRERERQLHKEMAERERAEAALQAAKEEIDFALVAAGMWIWDLNLGDCSFKWSPHHETVLGPRRGAAPGTCDEFLLYVHPEDRELLKAELARSVAERTNYEQEFRILWTDGSQHWILAKGRIQRDGQDVAQRAFGIMQEITGRKEARQALQRSEAQLHELADAMPQIVWAARPDGVIEYVNRKWVEYSGLPVEKAYSPEGWKELTHPEDLPRAVAAIQAALQSGQPLQIETRIRQRENGYRWHLSRALPVRDEAGRIVHWFATTTDIEDQKRTEQDLLAAKEQLARHAQSLEDRVAERTATMEATVRSLEGVLYHVAHDLRAPLRSLSSLTQMLMEALGPHLDAAGRDTASMIVAAAQHMDQLTLDLLAYGRLGHVGLAPSLLNVTVQVNHVLAQMDWEIRAKGAQVEVVGSMHLVRADATIFNEVARNVLENALTFVAPGVFPRVRVWAERRGDRIRLWIQDNGIGIEPEYQQRIFRVFERLHRPQEYAGTGIGLALVAKGMERMGGAVGVESKPGEGSKFWLELPAADGPA